MPETLRAKVYYTSTDPVFGKMTLNQFIETEVKEREITRLQMCKTG